MRKRTNPKGPNKPAQKLETLTYPARLNKFISNAGICSRRDADLLIVEGKIKINDNVVTELGTKVEHGDVVKFNGKVIKPQNYAYILINKPKDYITTMEDPENRKTVMQLIKGASESRIYPVGRLDRNTTGLLLFTNDGDLSQKLTHPSYQIKKIYQVELDKPLTAYHFEQISQGITLEDGDVKVDEIAILSSDKKSIGVQVHVGKNRIVRRIFEHFEYEVIKLDRTMYGPLTKKDLPKGKWRNLTDREVVVLKNLS
ncbi:MAG: pseudouridine synthase [Reichenbachiella sp.]|uniref:pseudouridine synthase n=1 Tax=Reichenbachiella sp. TaxID=2184521 RepID=UPI003263D50E